MGTKSYVTLEQHVCVVCTKKYDTGALLLDRRLRDSFEHHTVTDWGMCPACDALREDGFVALVECDPDKTPINGGIVQPDEAYRSGTVCHIRKEAFENVINIEVPKGMVCFVDADVIKKLQSMVPDADVET
ncbi:MAG: hypothetical protein KAJ55_11770 [Anaerolineales bacterium]|nr:hypothetical protein [Anaerolineales bacterium]